MTDRRLLEVDYATAPTAGNGLVYNAATGLFVPKDLYPTADSASEGTAQSTSSATPATIGGCSVSVTVKTGGAVLLTARGTYSLSTTTDLVAFGIYRDARQITEITQLLSPSASNTGKTGCFALSVVDKPAAGTYTYTLKWASTSGVATAYCRAASIQAVQLVCS